MTELRDISVDPQFQQILTVEQARQFQAVPFGRVNGTLRLYVAEGSGDASLADELELVTGGKVELIRVPGKLIDRALSKFYRKGVERDTTYRPASGGDVLQDMLREAKEMKASDIHFECYEDRARIRFRIDGHLMERYTVPVTEYPSMINRIKITANLDIAEKRLPQDGRIMVNTPEHAFDIRVSIVPTLHGEKAVLRLLSRDATNISIEGLGFSEEQLTTYLQGAKKPHGIILISGPTGSGKTTTLYATLKVLNSESRNILTIEDPIEYTLEGINQVQLNERVGLDFGRALRTFLRQDPDVIMLGEIRDPETARMAVRAALTGHLVLSTVHTNSAWGTVGRLMDMGIPPYLISGTLHLSVAQRLVRKLCPHCRQETTLVEGQLPKGYESVPLGTAHFTPVGCDRCYFTGYSGRKAIYEVIPLDSRLSSEVAAGNMEVRPLLEERGVRPIPEQALHLVRLGETSIEEVYSLLLDT